MEYLFIIVLAVIGYCCYQSCRHKPRNRNGAKEYSNMWEEWGEENKKRNKGDGDG